MQTLFNGRYKIIKTIGSGGMGTVYLAENVKLGTKWAIKAIEKKENANFDLLAEPNILKKLNHPALPRIIDIEQDDKNLYIIEDYIEGEPLNKQLSRRKKFDEATVIEWAKQLCGILLYLHSQKPNPVIYRDMKPSNIIVSPDNTVKVIDFGIAREFKTDSGSDTSYMGTRGYAAPEQYGTSQTDARTDIYSLGVTMYHLLTGKSPNEPPYEFKQLRQIDKGFSEGIEFIVNKCVQNDPKNRYQNVLELVSDLDNIHKFNSFYKKQKAFEQLKYCIKTVLLVGFSALLYLSGGVITAERTEKYNTLIETGYGNLNLYQFDEALACFNSASNIDKRELDAYLGIAQILLKQAEYDEAISYMEKIENQLPEAGDDAEFLYLKGSIYYEKKDYETAINYLDKAYNEDESKKEYAQDTAVCYAKLGSLQKAREILDEITQDSGEDDVLSYVNGQVLLAEGKQNEAVAKFEKVIGITENQDIKKRSYIEISDIYKSMRHQDKQNDTALSNQIKILERAVKDLENEDDLIITEAMAEAYFTAQEYKRSVEKFQKLLDIGYDRAYIYRNIAIIYQQTGDFGKAEDYLQQMKEKYPDNYQCYLQLAYLYMDIESKNDEQSRDYKETARNYNLAVQFSPNGKNTSDIIPLTNKINELKEKGWL